MWPVVPECPIPDANELASDHVSIFAAMEAPQQLQELLDDVESADAIWFVPNHLSQMAPETYRLMSSEFEGGCAYVV